MNHEQLEQARELHRTLEFIGLRAQATKVGLLQLCSELVRAGILDDDAIERIKESIFRELTAASPRGYNRTEFEQTLRKRLDSIFPRHENEGPRARVGTVGNMETTLDPQSDRTLDD